MDFIPWSNLPKSRFADDVVDNPIGNVRHLSVGRNDAEAIFHSRRVRRTEWLSSGVHWDRIVLSSFQIDRHDMLWLVLRWCVGKTRSTSFCTALIPLILIG